MELFKVIDIIAIFQILVFVVLLWRHKTLQQSNKVLLVFFLLSVLYCLLDRLYFFYRHDLNRLQFPHLYQSGEPFWYLHLPLLFLYIKSLTKPGFRLKWVQLIHGIPFFLALGYVLVNFSVLPADLKYEALKEGSMRYIPPHKTQFFDFIQLLLKAYLLACFYLIYQYRKNMYRYVSNIRRSHIAPLYIVLGAFVLMLLFRIILPNIWQMPVPIDLDLAVYSSAIIFLGYKQSKLFLNPSLVEAELPKNEELEELKRRILEYMTNEKPYLNPDLTLELLAEKVCCSSRKLSQVLNSELDSSFFLFVNNYRVEEAKILLSSEDCRQKTVLEILYEVGFNNKSAFNRVFKEHTKLTPTQFRKKSLKLKC